MADPWTLINAPYQVAFNDLVIGEGTPYDIVKITGLLDLANVRQPSVNYASADGVWRGRPYRGGRQVNIDVSIYASDAATLGDRVLALLNAFDIATEVERPIAVRVPQCTGSQVAVLWGSPLLVRYDVDQATNYGVADVHIEFVCGSTRVAGATVLLSTVGSLPVVTGGLTFPATPPFVFSETVSGVAMCTVGQTRPVRPIVSINGPVAYPSIVKTTTGESFTVMGSIPAGVTCTVNMHLGTAVLSTGGTLGLSGVMWTLTPGVHGVKMLSNSSTHTTESVVVEWSPVLAT